MKTTTVPRDLVFAVHATAFGFGWVLFEGPRSPLDWGIVSARIKREGKLFARFERILNRYEPSVLVMEAFEGREAQRSDRIQTIYRELTHRAQLRDMHTPVYGRDVVSAFFGKDGIANRYDIAREVIERIPALAPRIPRTRKAWDSEDPRQSLFDAAALALTYFGLMGED
jgi:hypothetical protein